MRFSELAQYFRRLAGTSGRNALVEILAELFAKTPAEEVPGTTYLVQGRLAPFFEPVEIGLGNNYVADAIARAFGGNRARVLERFDRLGDIGEAAAEIAAESGSSPAPNNTPPVREIFDQLLRIARTTGAGSVGAKVEAFASLLGDLDPLSCNYLCRMPLGRMRLGVGDPTVLDAFSLARGGRLAHGPQAGRIRAPAILRPDGPARGALSLPRRSLAAGSGGCVSQSAHYFWAI